MTVTFTEKSTGSWGLSEKDSLLFSSWKIHEEFLLSNQSCTIRIYVSIYSISENKQFFIFIYFIFSEENKKKFILIRDGKKWISSLT